MTTRARKDDDWGTPVNVGAHPNTSSWEGLPNISADERVLFFYSDRPGGYGGMDIYMAMRPTVSDAWGPAVNLGPMINTPYYDTSPSFSADGCTLHFAHNDVTEWGGRHTGWGGTFKIYRMTIRPVVDLNSDGIVDSADMCIIVDHWGEDYSLCDIGPTPFGDGIVDVQDLIVLSEHLFENVDDPTLIAHWALDETEGNTAQDSANANGDWYRVGFVRDGINRILYVDDIEVTRDTAETLESADAGLCIGAASTLAPGAYFSGLIDDVRIYNRAVKP